jgi:hypothetical protein
MGSHGGATAEGQREIVESLGVTESFCGCKIISSMETVKIGETPEGHEVRIDKNAAEADGIIVVNRIKAHTAFTGPYESGLMKMIAIGLGKQSGANVIHTAGFGLMYHLVPLFGKVILEKSSIIFGFAIIENAYDRPCVIRALTPQEIISEEPKLLIEAKKLMGRILIDETDVLIIDAIGKNISGDGADPNVMGKFLTQYASGGINAKMRVALDLTEESHGNATGIGLFDATTKRLFDKIDLENTYPNQITNNVLHSAKIPMIMLNDRDAIALAIKACGDIGADEVRIVRIRDTMRIGEIQVSESHIPDVSSNPNLDILSDPEPMQFDKNGNLF